MTQCPASLSPLRMLPDRKQYIQRGNRGKAEIPPVSFCPSTGSAFLLKAGKYLSLFAAIRCIPRIHALTLHRAHTSLLLTYFITRCCNHLFPLFPSVKHILPVLCNLPFGMFLHYRPLLSTCCHEVSTFFIRNDEFSRVPFSQRPHHFELRIQFTCNAFIYARSFVRISGYKYQISMF